MLLAKHDMDAVFVLTDWVSVLVQGRVIASGPAETVLSTPLECRLSRTLRTDWASVWVEHPGAQQPEA
jgi:ABC-type microcin C transport system duplicated ATPase subunit YejF